MDGFDLRKIIKEINAEADERVVSLGSDYSLSDLRGYISTGNYALDVVLGKGQIRGGLPLGRVVHLYGAESHGKSTLASEVIKSAQLGRGTLVDWIEHKYKGGNVRLVPKVTANKLKPGMAILIDSESSLDKERAQEIGVKLDKLIVEEVFTLEEGFTYIEMILEKVREMPYFADGEAPIVIVWDTIASVPTEKEKYDKEGFYADGVAAKPRRLKHALRKMTEQLSRLNALLVFVDQIIDRIFIPGTETGSGRAIRFWSTLRLRIKRKGPWNIGKENVGIETRVKIDKSKICAPLVEIPLMIRYTTGVDDDYSMYHFLSDSKLCRKGPVITGKNWYTIKREGKSIKFQYRNWLDVLKKNKGLRKFCREKIAEQLK